MSLLLTVLAVGLGCPGDGPAASDRTLETSGSASLRLAPSGSGSSRSKAGEERTGERIISLSPVATRFLVALGAADRLIAVDAASRALAGPAGSAAAKSADDDDDDADADADADDDAADADDDADADADAAIDGASAAASAAARLRALPTTTLATAIAHEADLVLLPTLPDDRATLAALEAQGTRVVEFAPHDLEDVYALCRGLGRSLVGDQRAEAFERRVARPIALVAGGHPPEGRPRVVAVVRVQPLEVAGGHSFETDLIEAAGGQSLTHGANDVRRALEPAELARLAPDLLVVTSPAPLDAIEEDRALRLLGDVAPLVFFAFDRDSFWLDAPAAEVERLSALIRARLRSPG